MSSEKLKGKWHQVSGEAKRQWGKLTDDDIAKVEGDSEKLVGVLQERYGYTKDRAEQEVNDWIDKA